MFYFMAVNNKRTIVTTLGYLSYIVTDIFIFFSNENCY